MGSSQPFLRERLFLAFSERGLNVAFAGFPFSDKCLFVFLIHMSSISISFESVLPSPHALVKSFSFHKGSVKSYSLGCPS